MLVGEQRLCGFFHLLGVGHVVQREEHVGKGVGRGAPGGHAHHACRRGKGVARTIVEAHDGVGALLGVRDLLVEDAAVDVRLQHAHGGVERCAVGDLALVGLPLHAPRGGHGARGYGSLLARGEPGHPLAHVEGDRIAEVHPAVVVPRGEEHDLVVVLGQAPLAGRDAADVAHIAFDGANGQVGSLGILLVGGQRGEADITQDRRAGHLRVDLGVGDLLVKRRAAVGFHAGHPRAGQVRLGTIEIVVQ